MNKLRYLANNIALFSISNFVSKILVFLLVPLYTNVLTTKEYGVADIFQVTLLLLVPALTVNAGEAALRFGIEKSDKRDDIFRIGMKYSLRAALIVSAVAIALSFFVSDNVRIYLFIFIPLFLFNAVYEFLILYFQGCEQVPVLVTGSVFSTLMMIICNIVFLLYLKAGLYGYLFSQIIAYLTASLVMLALGKRFSYIFTKREDRELEAEMLSYSRPMIAYSTASWVNNASDRYLVAGMLGAAVNGIYGVAYKIPAILMVFQRIFAQAWQMSATKAYMDDDSGRFFSLMYRVYNGFMVMGCSVLILLVKPLAFFLFRKDFYTAWHFVPPLLISVIFGALTGFLGSICLAHKDSVSMGKATGAGAVINIILNIAFIPRFGAMGAAAATGISYFSMCLLAFIFVRKHVELKTGIIRDTTAYILLIAESVIMINEMPFHYALSAAIVITVLLMYIKEALQIIRVIADRSKRKAGSDEQQAN